MLGPKAGQVKTVPTRGLSPGIQLKAFLCASSRILQSVPGSISYKVVYDHTGDLHWLTHEARRGEASRARSANRGWL